MAENKFNTYSHSFHIIINLRKEIQVIPINSNIHLRIDNKIYKYIICIKYTKVLIYRIFDKKSNLISVLSHHRKVNVFSIYILLIISI